MNRPKFTPNFLKTKLKEIDGSVPSKTIEKYAAFIEAELKEQRELGYSHGWVDRADVISLDQARESKYQAVQTCIGMWLDLKKLPITPKEAFRQLGRCLIDLCESLAPKK